MVQSLPPPSLSNALGKKDDSSGGHQRLGIQHPQLAPMPKQRLRWTPELHDRFIKAVTHLGGGDRKSSGPFCVVVFKLFVSRDCGAALVEQVPKSRFEGKDLAPKENFGAASTWRLSGSLRKMGGVAVFSYS